MPETYVFTLIKEARKSGGDRYTCTSHNHLTWDIYFPQKVSRKDGSPQHQITVEVKNKEVKDEKGT